VNPLGDRPGADAEHAGRLPRWQQLVALVIDEVGYIAFQPEAANLILQLVSSRYERASLIVTRPGASNRTDRRNI